jgi:ElaB/YqjD/DUF883 family membrane-anchored ribosome-binding protein
MRNEVKTAYWTGIGIGIICGVVICMLISL